MKQSLPLFEIPAGSMPCSCITFSSVMRPVDARKLGAVPQMVSEVAYGSVREGSLATRSSLGLLIEKTCVELSLDMFRDEAVVVNRKGIPCTVSAQQYRNRVTVHVSAKPYVDSPSCICCNSDDEVVCKCNWQILKEIKGNPRESFETAIDRAIAVVNSLKRCDTCGVVGEFNTCASCSLQKKINHSQDLDVMSTACPICLDDMIITSACILPCGHMLHIHCARRLTDDCTKLNNECPMCRGNFSFRHVSDYVP